MFKKSFFTFLFFFLFLLLTPYSFIHSRVYAYSETTYYIHQDNIGSVVAVTSDATTSSKIDYSSYGNSVGDDFYIVPTQEGQILKSVPTERAYTGQIQDSTTSLQYYNARYYDPTISRFISADQMGGGNRYSYVGNNPVSRSDPTGNKMDAGGNGGGGGGYTPPINTGYQHADSLAPFAQATTSVSGSVTVGGVLLYANQYSPAGIIGSMVNSAADSVGRNGNYLLNGKGDFGSNVVVATDMLTLGAFHGASSTFNQYGAWSAENPNANIFQRLGAAVSPGVAITGFSASFMGIGQLGTKALGVKAPTMISDSFGPDIEQYVPGSRPDVMSDQITLYKGIRGYESGTSVHTGGTAKITNTGYNVGAGEVNYSVQLGAQRHSLLGLTEYSEFSSWTTSPEVAQMYAGDGGSILQMTTSRFNSDLVNVQNLIANGIDTASLAESVGMSAIDQRFINVLNNNIAVAPSMQEYLLRVRVLAETLTSVYVSP